MVVRCFLILRLVSAWHCTHQSLHGMVDFLWTGLAYDYQPKAPRQAHEPDPHENPDEFPLIWQYSDAAPIEDLLDSWIENFRSLEWTANPYDTEGGIMLKADDMTDVSPISLLIYVSYVILTNV